MAGLLVIGSWFYAGLTCCVCGLLQYSLGRILFLSFSVCHSRELLQGLPPDSWLFGIGARAEPRCPGLEQSHWKSPFSRSQFVVDIDSATHRCWNYAGLKTLPCFDRYQPPSNSDSTHMRWTSWTQWSSGSLLSDLFELFTFRPVCVFHFERCLQLELRYSGTKWRSCSGFWCFLLVWRLRQGWLFELGFPWWTSRWRRRCCMRLVQMHQCWFLFWPLALWLQSHQTPMSQRLLPELQKHAWGLQQSYSSHSLWLSWLHYHLFVLMINHSLISKHLSSLASNAMPSYWTR